MRRRRERYIHAERLAMGGASPRGAPPILSLSPSLSLSPLCASWDLVLASCEQEGELVDEMFTPVTSGID
jgi:hypothetical protein